MGVRRTCAPTPIFNFKKISLRRTDPDFLQSEAGAIVADGGESGAGDGGVRTGEPCPEADGTEGNVFGDDGKTEAGT